MAPTPLSARPRRRGAALMMVLAILVLSIAIVAPAAERGAISHRDRMVLLHELAAMDLLAVAEAPIRRWLGGAADRVALPPDSESPGTTIAEGEFATTEGARISVRITAYDQCGMVPWGLVGSDRLLTFALPADLQWTGLPGGVPGLDLLTPDSARRVFPDPLAPPGAPAIGELIATHNPPAGRPGRAPAINVNTAPRRLVEAAMAVAGRSAIEQVMAARAAGRPFTAMGDVDGGEGIDLASRSDAWAFRIDVRAGPIRRSWWSVYTLAGSRWVRSQNLAIAE